MAQEAKDRPDVALFAEIGRIDQLFRTRLERVLPHGLTASQFGLLNHFVRVGRPQGPAELARAFHLTKGAMTNTLQRLQAQGFVDVAPDGRDGRRKAARLTPAGQAAHREAVAAVRPQMEALRAAFPAPEIAGALPLLEALRAWLERDLSDRPILTNHP